MPIKQWSDSIWVVELGDEPGLSEDLLNVRDKAESSKTMPRLVLDLGGVHQLNSSNLSQLLRLRKLTIDRDGRMVMANPNDVIWAVFITTGLDKVFEFAPDVPTALTKLQINL
ncbi:MAG: STAS domain-containing protein [Planctomycetes bacterium]|nr:STAS domain-containing protein [Planctomycetota bacterium]